MLPCSSLVKFCVIIFLRFISGAGCFKAQNTPLVTASIVCNKAIITTVIAEVYWKLIEQTVSGELRVEMDALLHGWCGNKATLCVCVCVCVWCSWTVTSPHPPYNVTVRTTARSAKVTWLPAYDGGHPQHYVLWSVFFSAHLLHACILPEPCSFYALSELRALGLLNDWLIE